MSNRHIIDIPVKIMYPGVVSFRVIQILAFLDEINEMKTWDTDIRNAYLKAMTLDKFYIKEGTYFGDREDHILIFAILLYGIFSSGL